MIRDFEIKGIDISLEDLQRSPPEGYDEVIVPGLARGRTQGQVFDDAVRQELARATHVLAFVDLPNANVGFEVGYALGLGKSLALVRVAAALPAWLNEPPLAGYLVPAARSAEQFRQLILTDHWIQAPAALAPGEGVLFMCPEGGEGASLHGSRSRCQPGWQVLPASGWSLPDLKAKLDGIGKVVWCLVPFAKDTDERDGRENAADAIVAGFAAARGLPLTVLRHAQARPVADLQQWEHRFSRLDEFERLLRTADHASAEASPPIAPPIAPQPTLPASVADPAPPRPDRRWRALGAGLLTLAVAMGLAWWGGAGRALLGQPGNPENKAAGTAAVSTVKDKRWPNGARLTVSFMGGKAQDHEAVRRHAAEWTKYANIDFDFTAPGTRSDARVAFKPDDGSWSFVGTDNKNVPADKPTMNLAWVDAPNVLHQFGHLLGLLHEHQNPNARFDWNSDLVLKETGWDKASMEANVTRRYKPDDYPVPKPFDPYSVMLYSFPARWTNGVVLNQGRVLSETDKSYVAKLYPGRWTEK